ncbi:MAG TPA: GSU2403 family nucleotidyltransferase fold protein [Solirubrobacterales bacterium]
MDELYVKSRSVLLDALEALENHRDSLILVGAQAIYLYTGEADVPIATRTKDSDLALDPMLLGEDPLLENAMTEAGFHRNLASGQPGEWLDDEEIPVDLLVPASLGGHGGRRSAQIPPHSKHSARKVAGLEAALVDNEPHLIAALDPGDSRSIRIKVAGPAALSIAKAYKLGERLANPKRLVNKDAHDLYRLLRATETEAVARRYRRLLDDDRSRSAAEQGIVYLGELFAGPASVGSRMAGDTEGSVGDPDTVAASASALVNDLLDEVSRR